MSTGMFDSETEIPARLPAWARMGTALIVLGASLCSARGAWGLWNEWSELRKGEVTTRNGAPIGFVEIHPRVSFAQRPPDWIHEAGGETLLWAGWADGQHTWFRFPAGQLSRGNMELLYNGRDVIRAIDEVLYEVGGGPRWWRMPAEAPVVVLGLDGGRRAYPSKVLEKVEVINETREGRPLLITYAPFAPIDEALAVFDPVVDGKRLWMRLSSYAINRAHLLYDRDSESFWVREPEGLRAIAGRYRGSLMPIVEEPAVLRWEDWRERNPDGELVIGADRASS